jgi:hypothetical protein
MIINGHKRIKAAHIAGLDYYPVEVIDVTDDQAARVVRCRSSEPARKRDRWRCDRTRK